ncbi:MAG: hypothetical protein LBN00_00020 [Oscillospiraceae bacterium]|jgi:beta-galactosidase/beta-glucuronidase|nr:hypothetical protein [Oscillospiraceae bacterium]
MDNKRISLASGGEYGAWRVAPATDVTASGETLVASSFDDANWLPATVPGTVLVSYVNAGRVPDPFYDDNHRLLDEDFFTADFWYRNTLTIPKTAQNRRVFLCFDAINWKSDIFFNGYLLKNFYKTHKHSIEGAFIRGRFDVTDYVDFGGKNHIAVKIYKNATPGLVTTQGLAEGPGPNGGLLGADNPTLHASVGWDWLPTIAGRNIGIYGNVYLEFTGAARLVDPWIQTDLDITETSVTLAAENFLASADTYRKFDAAGGGFTLDLGEPKTLGSVTILWGTESGGAAADFESRHAAKFRLETSPDGENWSNFDAHPGGDANTVWFGVHNAPPHAGTAELEGHAISDSVQGATAMPVIDMGSWGPGEPVPFPVFSPQKARYIRFTVLALRELNGRAVPTIIKELRAFAESPQQVEQTLTRKYALDASKANLTFRTAVTNSTKRTVFAKWHGEIDGVPSAFTRSFKLEPGQTLDLEQPFTLENPHLWWPNTYGGQHLYTAKFRVETDGDISDERTFKFGVRQFSYPIDGGILTLYCNGVRIVAKGGNWGMDDGLKRDTPEIYDHKVRLHAEANLTMIRNWIGMTNHDAFYDACDKYGVLVWDDFWLANPVDGPHPNDTEMFLENAADKIKHYRRHAALALYCGRNEGDPPPELNDPLRALTETLDGTRTYFPNSAMAPVGSGGGYSLAWQGGSRGVKQYFDDVTSPVLRSERGIPNVPTLESLRKFIAPEHLWPISETWALHDWTYHMNGPASSYMGALQDYLGGDFDIPVDNVQGQAPDESDPIFREYKAAVLKMCAEAGNAWTIEDFSRAAQMINFEHHRGLFDALAARRSNGLLMWMSQSSWPSLMWQTYDYYLDTNGGYFGVKAGNRPTRAIFDPRDDRVLLANHTGTAFENVVTVVELFDIDGKPVFSREYALDLLDADAAGVFVTNVDFSASPSDIAFLRLWLKHENNIICENIYWHNIKNYQDYRELYAIPATKLTFICKTTGENTYELTVTNTGAYPSVQTRIVNDALPVFYSDNYFTLLPGETRVITAETTNKAGEFYLG